MQTASFQSLIMNTKQFLSLFLSATLFLLADGFGSISTVAYNGALTIPLLSGSVGTFALPLAVLGVIKLGAAALLAGTFAAAGSDSIGFGQRSFRGRQKRSAVEEAAAAAVSDKEALFQLIASMDTYGCGKLLVCELEAKREALAADEALILTLFG